MIENGVELLEARQHERAVKILQQVPRMFPTAKGRFRSYIVLGKHFSSKRQFEEAIQQFKQVEQSENEDERAEALLQVGICQFEMNAIDAALVALRRVTQEYRWSVFANEAYYTIGMCHYKQKRWAKANEALKMVGVSVPTENSGERYAEAGQRLYIKIHDQDLAVLTELGRPAKVVATVKSGDRESVPVEIMARNAQDYIGSLPTAPGQPQPGDGVLQFRGGDTVAIHYVDENTRSGELNQQRIANAILASTAAIGFTDGAFKRYAKGVFAGQATFVKVRDLDLDTTPNPDTLSVRVICRFQKEEEEDPNQRGVELEKTEQWEMRDSLQLKLTETEAHSGIFTGTLWPIITTGEDATESPVRSPAIRVQAGDQLVLEYVDRLTINGEGSVPLAVALPVLIGSVPDVQSIEYRSEEMLLQARKLMVEARIFLKWALIFKDVGLTNKAGEKAAEGLERVEEVIRISTQVNLEREMIEETFKSKWELLMVQDRLREAIAVCQALTRLFPDSPLADQAFLRIAGSRFEAEEYEESVPLFRAVLSLQHADPDVKAEAQFRLGEIQEILANAVAAEQGKKPNLEAAISAYQQTAETYPDSHFAGESLQKIVNYYLTFKDYPRAIEMLERVVRDYPDKPWLDEMILKWGIAAYRMKNKPLAIAKFQQVVEEYPGTKAATNAKKFVDRLAR